MYRMSPIQCIEIYSELLLTSAAHPEAEYADFTSGGETKLLGTERETQSRSNVGREEADLMSEGNQLTCGMTQNIKKTQLFSEYLTLSVSESCFDMTFSKVLAGFQQVL